MGREDDQSFSEAYRPLWKMCVAKLEGAALGDLKTPVGVMRRDPSGENANRLYEGHAQRRGKQIRAHRKKHVATEESAKRFTPLRMPPAD
jgi:hypothetical protein